MNTPSPYEESPTASLPVPTPTQPVAGRPVDSDKPTFDWTPVPKAQWYQVQIAENGSFETLYYDQTADRPFSLSLDSVLPDDVPTACWRVRAVADDSTPSPWSDPAHFARSAADLPEKETALRVEAPPVPLQPDSRRDPPVQRSAVPFSWEPIPEASGYQLQIASDEAFEAQIVDLSLDQTYAVTLYDMLPKGSPSLYWRIRPLFRVVAPGPWSDPVPFSVSSSPTLDEDFAAEGETPENFARAAGPVEHARTSRSFSLFVSLFVVLSFAATVVLIVLMS